MKFPLIVLYGRKTCRIRTVNIDRPGATTLPTWVDHPSDPGRTGETPGSVDVFCSMKRGFLRMERRKRMRLLFYRSCRVEKEGKEEKEFPGW